MVKSTNDNRSKHPTVLSSFGPKTIWILFQRKFEALAENTWVSTFIYGLIKAGFCLLVTNIKKEQRHLSASRQRGHPCCNKVWGLNVGVEKQI